MKRSAHMLAVLAAVAVLAAGIFATSGRLTAEPAADARQAIALEPDERAFVLAEMRTFLQSVEGIVAAVANDRIAEAAAAAKTSGMAVMHAVPPALRQKLPQEFKMMGHATHQAFDALAEDARTIGDKTTALRQLEQILNTCNTCHASYRLSGG